MKHVVYEGDGLVCVEAGDTLITLWLLPPTMARWVWHSERIQALHDKQRDGFLYMSIIASTSTPPDQAVRGRIQEDLRRWSKRVRKVVIVPVGDSVWLSLVRALIRTMLIVTGQSKQQSVVATTNGGIAEIVRNAGANTPPQKDLEVIVDMLMPRLSNQPDRAA